MPDTTLELAHAGDINAIAALIEEKIGTKVNPRMQWGIILILETPFNNVDNFTKKIQVFEIIKLLEDIHCKIPSVKISGNKFQKTLTLSEGKYKDETFVRRALLFSPIYLIAIGLYIAYVPKVVPTERVSPSQSAAPSQSAVTEQRTFLGRSENGYELWADKSCVYVKGIRESDFARLNTTMDGYKQAVKQQTGFSCVLFE
ncbi:hypothetical protein CDG76_21070 [Nostoc sp. 'Peltigera membranacea cyanobiont' 210A]|uniref:hypothetical protein n=1 Tax=Nostoc sp. 'Peltigera membranacea cyanobiont' 210A TaxID=2014529 RepID=UPI000B95258A|nr:hypothetical protein [Nostoc sp. 'Peltigera membranacea cyanobiont' 210A]OYD93185.1 hypothetical protein CDG76_21070 [Nostoc sp. 'Peltigera membranacea cyanobiont' 210A]